MSSTRVKVVMTGLRQHIEREMIALTLDIQSNLREETPFKVGWARANWVITATNPSTGTVGSPDAPGPGNVGAAAILGYKLGQGLIFVANFVPYIRKLNAGSSTQAPAAFVQLQTAKALQGRGILR